MTYTEYNWSDTILCPYCGQPQDDIAEDFVIGGREEMFAVDQCFECGQNFSVRRNPETKVYEVKP